MWAYQKQTPQLSDRELELGQQMSTGSMKGRFAANRELLSYDPLNAPMLDSISKCGDPYPCHKKSCYKCYNTPLDPDGWRVDPSRFIADDVVNPVYYRYPVGKGSLRHIHTTLKMLEPFYGLPVDEIVPTTIKFCVLQGGEDYCAVKAFYAKWMREIAQGFKCLIHPDVRLTYRFERSWTTAGQVKWQLPLRAPGVMDVNDMDPDQVVALLHAHCIGHFPGFKYNQAGQFFRMVFDGPWQVHVAEPRLDYVLTDYSRDTSWLTIQDPLDINTWEDDDNHLPDHPDDVDGFYDCQCCDEYPQRAVPTIDECLDALADQYDQQLEAYVDQAMIDQSDLLSGVVKWVQYINKDQLPKAKSRLANKNLDPDNPESVAVSLTPEQMVIASHADAELKRALHGKHMVHSFGTVKRTRPVKQDDTTDDQCDVNQSQPDNGKAQAHHQSNGQDDAFEIVVPKWETASIQNVNLSATSWLHPQPKSSLYWSTHYAEFLYYYKEVCPIQHSDPLFYWVSGMVQNELCLGVRVLRPP